MFIKGDLYVEKFHFNEGQLQSLVFENPQYAILENQNLPTKNVPPYYRLYREVKLRQKKYWRLPRYFVNEIKKGFRNDNTIYEYDMRKPIKINSKLPQGFEYNDSQKETIALTTKYLRNEKGSFICAKPGEGKTVMAIGIICQLKQKTLILVQKDTMIKQWKDSLLQLTDLRENEVGLLKRGKFIDGKVVIGSQQSLMNTTFGREINDLFGLKIQDEAHKTPAPMFLRANVRFRTEYHLGLSATPNREDGLEQMYYYYVSNNIVMHKNQRSVQCNYRVYKYNTLKEWKEPYYNIPYKTQLINNIIADDRRISFIVEILRKHKSRKIVILGERIPHLKAIMDICLHEFPKLNIVRFFGAEVEVKKSKVNGRWKTKRIPLEKVVEPTLEELRQADWIFATQKKMGDAIDIPHLDTILYATPFGSKLLLEQSKGRVERLYLGKNKPLVIDIIDTRYGGAWKYWQSRKTLYLQLNMKKLKVKSPIKI